MENLNAYTIKCKVCQRTLDHHPNFYKGPDGVFVECERFVPFEEDNEKVELPDFWDSLKLEGGAPNWPNIVKLICDYQTRGDSLSTIIYHVTGGQLSKPDYDPDLICTMSDDECTKAASHLIEDNFECLVGDLLELNLDQETYLKVLERVAKSFGVNEETVANLLK